MLKSAVAAAALLAASLSTAPASAGGFNFSFGLYGPNGGITFGTPAPRHFLSESRIRRELRRDGWDDVDVEGRFGPNYRVEAEWYGQDYVLTVDARTADVLAYYPVGRQHFVPPPYPQLVPPPWAYGWPGR